MRELALAYFDLIWSRKAVKDHEEVITKLEKEIADCGDPNLSKVLSLRLFDAQEDLKSKKSRFAKCVEKHETAKASCPVGTAFFLTGDIVISVVDGDAIFTKGEQLFEV